MGPEFLLVDIVNKVNRLSEGEIEIGSLETLAPGADATASITGVFPLQFLNLGIPRGTQGEKGVKGDKGDTGAAGTNGTNGTNGIDGADGADGADGDPGPQGDPGVVQSINGISTADVVLDQDDIGDGTTYKQFSDANKTKLAGIATGATANATDAQLRDRATHTGAQAIATVTNLQTELDGKQAVDADLTAIAGLTPTNDDIIQRKAGAWINRTPTQYKADLGLVKGDVGLGNVDNTSDANKPVSTAAQTALDLKANTADLADVATSGSASDITTGTLPTSVLPPLAVNDVFVVANQAAMLALTAEKGDMAIRSDNGKTYVLSTNDPTTLADWKEVLAAGQVQSVNGDTGVVVLDKSDVGLGNVDNTSDANKPVSTAAQTALDGKQNIDADLTAIAGLSPSNDDVIQRKAGAWINRTPSQFKTDLALVKGDVGLGNVDNVQQQPIDADLTAIAGLTPTNDDVIQRKAGAWINRSMAQVKTDLALVKGDVGLGNVDNTSDATKNSAAATLTNKRITKRVVSTADTATLTIDSDSYDVAIVTALAQAMTIAEPTGTETDGQGLIIRIKDNGTARALTWNAAFRSLGATLPTTTVLGKTVYVGCMWNAADSKWDAIAVAQQA